MLLLAFSTTNGFLLQQPQWFRAPTRGMETFCQMQRHHVRCWELQRLSHGKSPAITKTSTTLLDSTGHDIETPIKINGDSKAFLLHHPSPPPSTTHGVLHYSTTETNIIINGNTQNHVTNDAAAIFLSQIHLEDIEVPMPTVNGGYTHTQASRAKIGAANKGKTPWNKGRQRSEEDKARIAAGVRARNRERFLQKLQDLGLTEEEYEANKKEERRKRDAERRARRTENGGYRPTEETKAKISKILKEKFARGEIKRRTVDPSKVRRGFTHTVETRQKISEALRQRWAQDTEYREQMTSRMKKAYSQEEVRKKVSETLKKKWQDEEFRGSMLNKMKKNRSSPEITDEYRDKISKAMKAKWQDPEYREKTLKAIANSADRRPTAARKPSRPRGSSSSTSSSSLSLPEVRLVKPLSPGESAKKIHKKKSGAQVSTNRNKMDALGNTQKMRRTDDDSVTNIKKKKDNKQKKISQEPEGSVNRLREERRDLFDLLYGDEQFDNPNGIDNDDTDANVDSLLDRLPSRFDLGDEDLDSFDPYGLDDY